MTHPLNPQRQLDDLARRIGQLSPQQRDEVERCVRHLELQRVAPDRHTSPASTAWPHAPLHQLQEAGTYIVTAGTCNKQHFFRTTDALDLLQTQLLEQARRHGWRLEAWACFSNHYHFVGCSPADANSLRTFLAELHATTARALNLRDRADGRQVWFNFWETRLTFEKSYFARLNYVHQNAVRHKLVRAANQYSWCSAAWFERTATPAQVKTIYSFKTDRLKVLDEFDVELVTQE